MVTVRQKKLYMLLVTVGAILILGFCARKLGREKLVISEVCTHNDSAAHDEYGRYGADYVEIYNPTKQTINLSGWMLSDSAEDRGKYVFPDITIEPEMALIVWCNEEIYSESEFMDTYIPYDLHCVNFNLSKGEYCVLSDEKKEVISRVAIPDNIPDNMTFSTSLADFSKYTIEKATPYYLADEASGTGKSIHIEEPVFNVDGGWYDQELEVKLISSEGEVYYTLDGSDPDEHSARYDQPITISNRTNEDNYYSSIKDIELESNFIPDSRVDKATIVKAIAISDNGESDIVTKTFFVGLDPIEYDGISIMSLVAEPDALFGYDNGIYRVGSVYRSYYGKIDTSKLEKDLSVPAANFSMEGKGWERQAQIEYLDARHEKVLEQKVGIRIHGGWSTLLNQKSFNLYSRTEYDGNDFLNYDFYDNGKQYNKLVLRSGGGGEDLYLGKLRDVFNQSLVSDRAVGTQRATPCVLFLNGEYWGLYNLQETASDNYVWNYYGVPEDEVVVVKRKYGEYIAAKEENEAFINDYLDILEFAQNNDMSITDNYRYIESRMDIQSLIDYYVVTIYTGCSDAYYNNVAVWRSKNRGSGQYEDVRWRYFVTDLDDSDSMDLNMNTPEVDSFVRGNWTSGNGPLIDEGFLSSLIVNPEFKERFIASFKDMVANNFDYASIQPKLWEMAEVCRAQNVKSQLRFRGEENFSHYPGYEDFEPPYDEYDFGYDIGLIDGFYRERADYMLKYLQEDLE